MKLHLLQGYFLIISDQNVQPWLCPVIAALAGLVEASVMNLSENPTQGLLLMGRNEQNIQNGVEKEKKNPNSCFFSPFLAVSMLQCH